MFSDEHLCKTFGSFGSEPKGQLLNDNVRVAGHPPGTQKGPALVLGDPLEFCCAPWRFGIKQHAAAV
jgi:hypothetical protein